MIHPAPVITVKKLDKVYRDGLIRRRAFQALTGVSFHVQQGEIFGLLGPNGAGKTTFVKILLGIVRATGGSATMLGLPAGDRVGRKDVGYLPENLRVPRHHTALTALDLYGHLSGMTGAEIQAKAYPLLESVGLAGWEKSPVKKFSKGMLQRLGLAQALLHDPDLLFLDEPTDGLDPVGRAHVRQVLQQLKSEGKTIFLNSHLLQEVEMICDRVAILDKGILRGVGTIEEITPNRPEGIELQLEVKGDKPTILTALGSRKPIGWDHQANQTFGFTLRLLEQADVDCCVDDLRRAGLSIVGLTPRRITLEDAFLELLDHSERKT